MFATFFLTIWLHNYKTKNILCLKWLLFLNFDRAFLEHNVESHRWKAKLIRDELLSIRWQYKIKIFFENRNEANVIFIYLIFKNLVYFIVFLKIFFLHRSFNKNLFQEFVFFFPKSFHSNTGNRLHLCTQVAECHLEGRECIMVTSGAVAFGKQKLTQELLMSLSMRETLSPNDAARKDVRTMLEPRAAAAVGQSGLMSLYDAMFSQYGVKIAQVLVTKPDFYNDETRNNLISTLSELISLNIVPIINTNDAVTPPPQDDALIKSKGKKVTISRFK